MWMKAIGRQFSNKSNFNVCDDHFDVENDVFYRQSDGRPMLRSNIVPRFKIEIVDPLFQCLTQPHRGTKNHQYISDLEKKNMRCNICDRTFPASSDQLKTLRVHFMQHKTSVVLRKNDGVTYRTAKLEGETGSPNQQPESRRLPIISNNILPNKHQTQSGPVVTKVVQAERQRRSRTSFEFPLKLPIILRQRKQVHVKPMPDALLDQLRSSTSQSVREPGNSHIVIGSTLIKPLKQQVKVLQSVDGIPHQLNVAAVPDEDDDIEIVEQVPELIVIDDNDELGGSK